LPNQTANTAFAFPNKKKKEKGKEQEINPKIYCPLLNSSGVIILSAG
jgi:hypothetical protein